ncbi:MAG: hypothetical protein QOK37_893 [Thermoanaerobaculia bacterium]|jgi:hypothetical protein|nr:hypothetical protein [Thermoanaerobaculia bacterium]
MSNNRGTFMKGFATGTDITDLISIPSECCMYPGDYIVSDNGVFIAEVGADGTFAVYRGTDPSNTAGEPMWKSLAGSMSYEVSPGLFYIYVWIAPESPCYFALVVGPLLGDSCLNLSCYYADPTAIFQMTETSKSGSTYSTLWSIGLQLHYNTEGGVFVGPGFEAFDYIITATYWKISNMGQVEIYAGTGPDDPASSLLLQYGPTDSVTSCVITSIEYDTSMATFQPAGDGFQTIAVGNVQTNDSASDSNSVTFSGEATVDYTSGWSNSFSETEGSSTEISAGVSTNELPFVDVDGGISVSTSQEFTNTTELNGTQEWSMTLGYNYTFTVPPYTVMRGLAQITKGTLTVPFTMTGQFIFASGAKLQTTGYGVYVGNNCLNDSVFAVDIGYSIMTLSIDASADYRASFCLMIVSPTNNSLIYTSPSTQMFGPGESQSINLADYDLSNNCFFVGGEQTNMYPVLQLSDGTTIEGDKHPVYKPSQDNDHLAVYDCGGSSDKPACVFNVNQSG